ncbi:MAG TPA: SDR family oxidoreductase [bacterium]|nr:SDR family oxidoreductase [Chlamydiota bacterium]HOE27950.1 SDR family oxidoreductase [bacterium]
MQRILITGASGFLGWNLARSLSGTCELWGTFASHPVDIPGCLMERLDLEGAGDLTALVRRVRPAAVLHAAALVDVDLCEREPARARRLNVEAVGRIAEAAAEIGARLVYFSSDMVFDGTKGMYTEEDEPSPISVYGETKLEGERLALRTASSNVVARLSLMYGAGPAPHSSFLGWMRGRLEKGETVNLFTDQYRTPLYVRDACRAIGRILARPEARGVYHLAGPERMNRYELGRLAAAVFGFPERLLNPVRMDEMQGLMPRPKDNSMDNRKAARELGMQFTKAADGLGAVAREAAG